MNSHTHYYPYIKQTDNIIFDPLPISICQYDNLKKISESKISFTQTEEYYRDLVKITISDKQYPIFAKKKTHLESYRKGIMVHTTFQPINIEQFPNLSKYYNTEKKQIDILIVRGIKIVVQHNQNLIIPSIQLDSLSTQSDVLDKIENLIYSD
jgi:hypothetical protein